MIANLAAWSAVLPLGITLAGLLYLPGVTLVRAARFSQREAWLLAPTVSLAVIGVAGVVFARLQVPWQRTNVLLLVAAVALLGLAAYVLGRIIRGRKQRPGRQLTELQAETGWTAQGRERWLLWATTFGAVALAVTPLLLAANPADPPQQWDPVFHLNAAWGIAVTGNGSTLDSTAPALGPGATVHYYPAIWHQWVAAIGGQLGIVKAANASSVVTIVVWVLGATGLVRTTLASHRTWARPAAFVAPFVAAAGIAFPADLLGPYVQWPNALGFAVLPGLLAVTISTGRRALATTGWRKLPLPQALLLFFGLVGATLAHPAALLNSLVFLGPAFVHWAWLWLRHSDEGDRWSRKAFGLGLLIMLSSALYVVATDPRIQGVGNFPRAVGGNYLFALARAYTPYAPLPEPVSLFLTLGITGVLLTAGAVALWRRREYWLLVSWAVSFFLATVSFGPANLLRKLTGPWYTDARRLNALLEIPVMILVVAGICILVVRWSAWPGRTGWRGLLGQRPVAAAVVLFVVLTLGGGFASRMGGYAKVYDPAKLGSGGMVSRGELDFLRTLPELLPADALVLGDPGAGAAYVQAIGQRRVVNPQLGTSGRAAEVELLDEEFKNIHRDPQVCAAVRQLGVTHFWQRPNRYFLRTTRAAYFPGLYGVDTSTGFRLVGEAEGTKLFEITACQ